jgi:hypothetical protein
MPGAECEIERGLETHPHLAAESSLGRARCIRDKLNGAQGVERKL